MLNRWTIIKKVGKSFVCVVSFQKGAKGTSSSIPPKVRCSCIETQLIVIKFKNKIAKFIRNERKIPNSHKVGDGGLGRNFNSNQLEKCNDAG